MVVARFRFAVIIVVTMMIAVGAQTPPANPDVTKHADFFERCEAFRDYQMAQLKFELALVETQIIKAKKLGTDPKESDELTTRHRAISEKLSALTNKPGLTPVPFRNQPTVGDQGAAPLGATVFQKMADDEAFMRFKALEFVDGHPQIMVINIFVKGLSMAGQTDGKEYQGRFPVVEVTENYNYQTNLGGMATMPLVRPVDEVKLLGAYDDWKQRRYDDMNRQKTAALVQSTKDRVLRDAQAKAEAERRKKDDENKSAVKREKDAESALNGAKFLKESGSVSRAKERLKEVIRDYPGTNAAKEAGDLLTKW